MVTAFFFCWPASRSVPRRWAMRCRFSRHRTTSRWMTSCRTTSCCPTSVLLHHLYSRHYLDRDCRLVDGWRVLAAKYSARAAKLPPQCLCSSRWLFFSCALFLRHRPRPRAYPVWVLSRGSLPCGFVNGREFRYISDGTVPQISRHVPWSDERQSDDQIENTHSYTRPADDSPGETKAHVNEALRWSRQPLKLANTISRNVNRDSWVVIVARGNAERQSCGIFGGFGCFAFL